MNAPSTLGLEFYGNAKTTYRPQKIKEVKNIVIMVDPCTLGLQVCVNLKNHMTWSLWRCKLPVKFHMGP
jgi:hypothetical protein